ncbi:MAG: ABC transporter permease [Deltaproteobacteria bacterium]|nr:ABC transporter permease [Deltaproteobacteria bacterium]
MNSNGRQLKEPNNYGPSAGELMVTLPSFLWLLILFLIPTLIIFAITFRPTDPYGGVGAGWTLETLRSLGNPNYPAIIWRTVWLSVVTTAVCILFATPVGYYMARAGERWRRTLLLLVIIPFWTSFLIRIFAWKVLLHPEGLIKKCLAFFQFVDAGTSLLYNPWAVLLVMVYSFLPFAILPIYAAAEKFDFHLIEAARDLGARQWQGFYRIFLPGVRRGILTAVLVVFIPALGSYLIPDIVGGADAEMIGNKIAQRVFVDRNLPHASGLSALLTLAVFLPMAAVVFMQKRREKPETIVKESA